MASTAESLPGTPPHTMPVREARLRLPQLAAMMTLTDRVTVLTDDTGHPTAALVPAQAARTVAEMRQARARAAATAAGWERRLESVRAHTARQGAARLHAAVRALAEAWEQLDRRFPPGTDPALDRLRAAHQPWLAAAAESPPAGPRG